MKNADNNTDNHFKNAFEHFKVPPPKPNWERIEKETESKFDEQFKLNLKPLKVTPKAHNWKIIKEEIPLHPGAKRYIGWMTKVAAVLVIGMLLSILSDQQKQSQIVEQKSSNSDTHNEKGSIAVIEDTPIESTEFVYEVAEANPSKKQRKSRKTDEEAEIKNLLMFILDDDEDLAELADTEVINESLKPLDAPEDNNAVATLLDEEKEVAIDLEINIPLIVVETEQEAAKLIQIYDSSQQQSNQVD